MTNIRIHYRNKKDGVIMGLLDNGANSSVSCVITNLSKHIVTNSYSYLFYIGKNILSNRDSFNYKREETKGTPKASFETHPEV